MKILDQNQYTQLRGKGNKLIGRLKLDVPNSEWIYFQISEDQQTFSATEILDTLSLAIPSIKTGEYIVFRHWTQPEVKNISYSI